MTTTAFTTDCRHRRPPTIEPETDAQLLERFIADQDGDAFAQLVRRHGAMVLGVCQRILHNPHDAEDCFQAAFLVLVRKAESIQPTSMVGNWLYGVAYRTALEARKMAAKRRALERKKQEMPTVESDADRWEELRPVLDQELNRLPDDFRAVVVLCDLEGKTRLEAAQQLGLPPGTVASRLARGRALLAKRLARHSLAMSAPALAAILVESAPKVPAWLMESTSEAAARLATGSGSAGLVSVRVAELTELVARGMTLTRINAVLATLLVLITLGIGIGTFITPAQANVKPDARKMESPDVVEPSANEKIDGTLYAIDENSVTVHGEDNAKGLAPKRTYDLDGKAVVFIDGKKATLGDLKKKMKISLQVARGKELVTDIKAGTPKAEEKRQAIAEAADPPVANRQSLFSGRRTLCER